jgi:outer membrane biogenesis lipoprotein LolB
MRGWCNKVISGIFVFLLLLATCSPFITGCSSSKPGSKPHKSQYRTSTYKVKVKSINDIQYKGAYKYDTDGKKYKKHYRKKKRRENR